MKIEITPGMNQCTIDEVEMLHPFYIYENTVAMKVYKADLGLVGDDPIVIILSSDNFGGIIRERGNQVVTPLPAGARITLEVE